jgi:hypothetical protein
MEGKGQALSLLASRGKSVKRSLWRSQNIRGRRIEFVIGLLSSPTAQAFLHVALFFAPSVS